MEEILEDQGEKKENDEAQTESPSLSATEQQNPPFNLVLASSPTG